MVHRLIALVLPIAALVLVPVPAQAAVCSGDSGVTVVVRFPDRTETRCASGNPSSGYAALESAFGQGFITYAQGNGAGAVCRLGGVPSNVNCGSMPPANYYWSYWHAKPGGSWTYSTVGGGGYDPAPGSVEGWVLGNGQSPPSSRAPSAPAPKPTPKPSTNPGPKPTPEPSPEPSPKSSPGPNPGTSASAQPSTQPGVATTDPTEAASALPGSTSPTASDGDRSGESPGTASAADAATVTEATTPLSASEDDGSASWVWGVAVVGVLGAAAGAALLRRRRA